MLNMIFLKYVTVEELTKVLGEFIGENATMYSYAPANLLFILDSRRNMRRTMELISLFDSDTFANQRVRLFEVKNTRPSDVQKDLENVLKAVSLDGKTATVRFLPVDRINTLIAVAPNPGVFETIAEWLRKLDVPVQVNAGAVRKTHVYHVRYGRAECLAIALNQLYGVPGEGYGRGYGGNGYGGGTYPNVGGYPQQYGAVTSGFGANSYGTEAATEAAAPASADRPLPVAMATRIVLRVDSAAAGRAARPPVRAEEATAVDTEAVTKTQAPTATRFSEAMPRSSLHPWLDNRPARLRPTPRLREAWRD